MLIAFPNGLAISKVRDSEVGISPTAFLRYLVISEVPIVRSSDGINIMFKAPFSEL